MQTFSIALIPSKRAVTFIRKKERFFSQTYGSGTKNKQTPYIYVKGPFESGAVVTLEKFCESIAKKTKPVDIDYSRYGFFEPSSIFISINSSPALVKLHVRLLLGLSKKFGIQKNSFEGPYQHFFTELAVSDISAESFTQAKSELGEWERPTMSFTAKELVLLVQKNEKWVVHKKFPLKQA